MRKAHNVDARAQRARKARAGPSSPASSSSAATVTQMPKSPFAASSSACTVIFYATAPLGHPLIQNPSNPSPAPASSAVSSTLPAYIASSTLAISP